MKSSKFILLFSVYFLCTTVGAVEVSDTAPDSVEEQKPLDVELAAKLSRAAQDYLFAGELEQALTVAKQALTFNPDNSDALYMSVGNLFSVQEETRAVETALAHALKSDTWLLGYRRDALHEYVKLLSRTYEDQQVIRLLEAEPNTELDPDLQYYLVLAYFRVGESERAMQAIASVQAPYDRRFFVLQVMHSKRPTLDYELQQWLEVNMVADPDVLSLLRYYIVQLYNRNASSQIPSFLNYYKVLGGKDPLVFLLAVAAANADTSSTEESIEEFFTHGGAKDKYLIDMIMASREHSVLQGELRRRMAGYSGTLAYDSDRDGFSEASYVVENEMVTEWHIDDNQDGVSEWSIDFTGSLPHTVQTADPAVLYEYYFYPRVGKITYLYEEYYEIWYPSYNNLSMPIIDYPELVANTTTILGESRSGVSFLQALRRLEPISVPSIKDIAEGLFFRYRSYDDRVLYYQDAAPWLEVRDTNGDTKTDEIYFLQHGVPLISMHDRDYNSIFEYFILYENAVPSYTLVDEDGDNAVEYMVGVNEDASFLPADDYNIEQEHKFLESLYRFAHRVRQQLESELYVAP